jgi:hypothetical protein
MVVPSNMGCQITMGKIGIVDEVNYVNCDIYNNIEGKPMHLHCKWDKFHKCEGIWKIKRDLFKKDVKKNESYLIRSILLSCKKPNIVCNMHKGNYGVVNGSRNGRGVSM